MGGHTARPAAELPDISPCAGAAALLGLAAGLGLVAARCISSSTMAKAGWRGAGSTSGQVAGANCAPTSAAGDIPPEWIELCVLELGDVVDDDDDDDAGEEDVNDEDPDVESDDDDGEDVPGGEPSCDGMVCIDSSGESGGDAGDVGEGGCPDSWR